MVRLLMQRGAGEEYLREGCGMQENNENDENKNQNKKPIDDDEEENPFVKPMDAGKHGKYTPLHWASYKGWYKVVWILLKYGISPLEIDMYGNTAVH